MDKKQKTRRKTIKTVEKEGVEEEVEKIKNTNKDTKSKTTESQNKKSDDELQAEDTVKQEIKAFDNIALTDDERKLLIEHDKQEKINKEAQAKEEELSKNVKEEEKNRNLVNEQNKSNNVKNEENLKKIEEPDVESEKVKSNQEKGGTDPVIKDRINSKDIPGDENHKKNEANLLVGNSINKDKGEEAPQDMVKKVSFDENNKQEEDQASKVSSKKFDEMLKKEKSEEKIVNTIKSHENQEPMDTTKKETNSNDNAETNDKDQKMDDKIINKEGDKKDTEKNDKKNENESKENEKKIDDKKNENGDKQNDNKSKEKENDDKKKENENLDKKTNDANHKETPSSGKETAEKKKSDGKADFLAAGLIPSSTSEGKKIKPIVDDDVAREGEGLRLDTVPVDKDSEIGRARESNQVIYEGDVFKKRFFFSCCWHSRYFVLTKDGMIKYYRDKNGKGKGNIDIATIRDLHRLDELSKKYPYKIILRYADREDLLGFNEEAERNRWAAKLNEARKNLI